MRTFDPYPDIFAFFSLPSHTNRCTHTHTQNAPSSGGSTVSLFPWICSSFSWTSSPISLGREIKSLSLRLSYRERGRQDGREVIFGFKPPWHQAYLSSFCTFVNNIKPNYILKKTNVVLDNLFSLQACDEPRTDLIIRKSFYYFNS